MSQEYDEYIETRGRDDIGPPDWLPCFTPHCPGAWRMECVMCGGSYYVCACGCGGRECECGEMEGD